MNKRFESVEISVEAVEALWRKLPNGPATKQEVERALQAALAIERPAIEKEVRERLRTQYIEDVAACAIRGEVGSYDENRIARRVLDAALAFLDQKGPTNV